MQRRPHRLDPRLPRLRQLHQRSATAPTPPARPVPAPRLRPRPPGPPRTAPRLATTLGPGPGRLGFRPRGGRPRAYLSACGSSCGCCLRSPIALAATVHGAAGYWAASAAREELRPERAPPSRLPVPSFPSSPPSAAGSAPRPARQAPPLPAGPTRIGPPTPPPLAKKGAARDAARAAGAAVPGMAAPRRRDL